MSAGGSPTICAADVVPVEVSWLWEGWLPKGKLVLLDGNPGCGKTTIALDLVARLTSGQPLPDGNTVEPVVSLILNTEDGMDDTIVPRLIAADADLDLIHLWDFGVELPSLSSGARWLEEVVRELGVGLVVIDPLMALLGVGIDSHRDQDVRRGLNPLVQLGATADTTVLALRHLTKSGGVSAMNRGMGSIAFTGLARTALHAGTHPVNRDQMVFSQVKNNLSKHPRSLLYRIEDRGGRPGVSWEGDCDLLADDLVGEQPPTPSVLARSTEWLEEVLAEEPIYCKDVERQADDAGISTATLRRAKKDLGVTNAWIDGRSCWSLPAQHAQTQDLSTLSRSA